MTGKLMADSDFHFVSPFGEDPARFIRMLPNTNSTLQ